MKPHIKPCKTCLNARLTKDQLDELGYLFDILYLYYRSQGVKPKEALKEVDMSKKLFGVK